ncbi:acetyl-CoA synthetase-like protein [Hyaloscypha variabilis]
MLDETDFLIHQAVSTNRLAHPGRMSFSAYTFDACIFEIFSTLLFGGCVCVINKMNVNLSLLTPAVVGIIEPDTVPSLQTLIIGDLIYIGRKDTQIKIRGQRVELGEVEHHLQACIPHTKQIAAGIIHPTGEAAGLALAAFLSFQGQKNDSLSTPDLEALGKRVRLINISSEIKNELSKRLPGYMIPTFYFSLAELPMTASSKLD